ncbi:hypothetical protein [Daejeonella sp.]|uniref:hypothetical protein n=1 Tax=Daejeonella sp. TaxID=2805397 RepID=UPI00398342AE
MTSDSQSLILDETAIEHLRIARKWSNVLSIIGIVIIGIMLLAMAGILVMASRFPQDELVRFTATTQMLPIALMMLIYVIPIYYLYQFGKHSRIAINNYDSEAISKALKYLKLHYRFMAILVIVVLVLYIIAIVAMVIGFSFFFRR